MAKQFSNRKILELKKEPVFAARKRPGFSAITKRRQFKKVDPNIFKFHIPRKQVIYSGEVSLKGGGKIKVEAHRNVGDGAAILPVNNSIQQDKGEWTCSVKQWTGDVYNSETVILNPQLQRIYPGAVFPFQSIATGEYKEVPYARKPLTLVSDNAGFKIVKTTMTNPSFGDYMEKLVQMKKGAAPEGGRTVGTSSEMWSEEDFFLQTGGSGYYLGFGGNFNINFKNEKKSFKYFAEVFQAYYTILINTDFDEPKKFFFTKAEAPNNAKAIAEILIDPNWVYVDSVTYGRLLYVVYESAYSFSSMGIDATAYANFGFAGGEANLSTKQKRMLQQTNVTVAAIGGNNLYAGLLNNASSFKDLQRRIDDYFKQPGGEALISYSLRTLDQSNVGARMVTNFTSRQCALRASAYKVSWDSVICTKNDDSGNAEEIKAFVRIRAIKGNGKDILDSKKYNKDLLFWLDNKAIQGIKSRPWTFTEGTAANPLELSQSEVWSPNKNTTFNIPADDDNAKIAIRVDVLEFDDVLSANDNFADQTWERKITELSDMEEVILTTRHEGSRITFVLYIEPVY